MKIEEMSIQQIEDYVKQKRRKSCIEDIEAAIKLNKVVMVRELPRPSDSTREYRIVITA